MKEGYFNGKKEAYLAVKAGDKALPEFYYCHYCLKDDYTEINNSDFVFAPFDLSQSKIILADLVAPCQTIDDTMLALPYKDVFVGTDRTTYSLAFEKVIENISKGTLDKLVLSRKKIHRSSEVSAADIFQQVYENNPTSFSYMFAIPDHMCWIGSSPEPLLTDEKTHLLTTALAGTQALRDKLEDIQWGQKEIEEHSFIEKYLTEQFTDKSIHYSKTDSFTVAAAAVCHIRSDFRIHPETDIVSLLKIIHPGPALSGYPRDKSVSLIKQIETHNREYYTGFFGFTGKTHALNLYANLRCMSLYSNGMELYVGGGLTKDSNEQMEWEETEMKSKTMEKAIEAVMKMKLKP